MNNAQSPALWLGTERHWSTASHGIVLEQIVFAPVAYPIFLIDEIDKAPQDGRHEPLAALLTLLEPVTACTGRDAGLDITFDASLAIYIATSNDGNRIPEPLRSRFREFAILQPRGADALQLAHAVAVKATRQLGLERFAMPDRKISHKLAHLTAREIYQAVQDAAARAIEGGRLRLTVSDFSSEILGDEPLDGSGHFLH